MGVSTKVPGLDMDNTPFWTGGREGLLRICRCTACGHYQHPPLPACPQCGGDSVAYPAVSGRGQVVTYSVNFQSWFPGQSVPFVLAMIELAEQRGLWLMSNVVKCQPDTVHVGMPVQVCFEQREDVWLPVFEPAETSS